MGQGFDAMDNFWMDFLINFMILIIYKITIKIFGCFTIKDNQAVKHLAMTGGEMAGGEMGFGVGVFGRFIDKLHNNLCYNK